MTRVGIDGCPDGWLAVEYDGDRFVRATRCEDVAALQAAYGDAETAQIDVPVGLREERNDPRRCDSEARALLGSPRGRSVFPPPVRDAVAADSYAEAREVQEERTGGSVAAQTWGIADRIAAVDAFLREAGPGALPLREAHPNSASGR